MIWDHNMKLNTLLETVILADHVATHGVMGCWHDTVCL